MAGLYIFEQYQKKGYGKKVIDYIKKHITKNIYLDSIPNSKAFWKKQGWKEDYYDDESGLYKGFIDNQINEVLRLAGVNNIK